MKNIIVSSLLATSLVACGLSSSDSEHVAKLTMLPNEVLAKSAEATKTLQSAVYNGSVTFQRSSAEKASVEGSATISGIIQSAKNQVQFMIDLMLEGEDVGSQFTVNTKAEVIVADLEEVYLKLHSLSIEPDASFLSAGAVNTMVGSWWLLPATQGIDQDFVAVTPDPSLLQAQAEIVKIAEDKGPVKLGDVYTYHYGVEVDKKKLLAFLKKSAEENAESFDSSGMEKILENIQMDGELWIDAETFHTRKLLWNVSQEHAGEEGFAVTFQATIGDHNNADPITPPVDAKDFSPLLFLQNPLPSIPDIPEFNAAENNDSLDDLDPETRKMVEDILRGAMPTNTSE